jgi:hypothetical protein
MTKRDDKVGVDSTGQGAAFDPVQLEFRRAFKDLATQLDVILNGEKSVRNQDVPKIGFALFMFKFGEEHSTTVNYISNADRDDIIYTLETWLARTKAKRGEQ